MTLKDIITIGIAIIGTTLLVWLSGYATGLYKGIETGKDYSFEKVAKEAVQTAKETLEIAKKLREDKDKLQKENDLLKEQLNQNEQ